MERAANLQICHALASATRVNQGVEPRVSQQPLARFALLNSLSSQRQRQLSSLRQFPSEHTQRFCEGRHFGEIRRHSNCLRALRPIQGVGPWGRVHFAVYIYHPGPRLTGEGKDMVPERPPVKIRFGGLDGDGRLAQLWEIGGEVEIEDS